MDYDLDPIFKYINETNMRLKNTDIANLLNANGIGNLPSINIITENADIQQLQRCATGPIFLGASASELSCRRMCGSNASILNVTSGQEIFSNGHLLTPGAWCTVNRPNCNMNTSYAIATANSVACRSKFPRMFGGLEGNRVIGCNNENFFNVNNVLWDNENNRRVTQFTRINNVDEPISNGTSRFTCQFGEDMYGNKYVPHAIDRLHPSRNFCTQNILRAHLSVTQNTDGSCNCGDFATTRVRNQDIADRYTQCSSCFRMRTNTTSQTNTECFTMFSIYSDVFEKPPCMPSRFLDDGAMCETFSTEIVVSNGDFLFNPLISGTRHDSASWSF
jgi:hypothetical protein